MGAGITQCLLPYHLIEHPIEINSIPIAINGNQHFRAKGNYL